MLQKFVKNHQLVSILYAWSGLCSKIKSRQL